MARPKKDPYLPGDVNVVLCISMPDRTANMLDEKAKAAGLQRSTFLRRLIEAA